MTPRRHPLGDYARYYWGTTEKGAKVIRGALVWGRQIGIHIIDGPLYKGITDQGCDWIFIRYEPVKDDVSTRCDRNG